MAWLKNKVLRDETMWEEAEPASIRVQRGTALGVILVLGILMVVLIAWDAGRSRSWMLALLVGAHVGWVASRVGAAGRVRAEGGRRISASLFRAGLGCIAVAACLFFLYPAVIRNGGSGLIRVLASAMSLGQAGLVFWTRLLVASRETAEVTGVAASSCPACGYSLVGMPTLPGAKRTTRLRQCPECGWIDIPTKRRDASSDESRLAAAREKVQAEWEPPSGPGPDANT